MNVLRYTYETLTLKYFFLKNFFDIKKINNIILNILYYIDNKSKQKHTRIILIKKKKKVL